MELSRSEQKRRVKQLEELTEELAVLPPALLDQLPAPEEVRMLLKETADLGRDGARKRQIKHITKLLREESSDALYQFLAKRNGTALLKKKQQHELEHLRDALIEEAIAARRSAKEQQEELTENWPSEVAKEIAATLPAADQKELARLAFFFAVSRNPRHSRELFRMLQAAQGVLDRAENRMLGQ
jgi:ribosome-associated protein